MLDALVRFSVRHRGVVIGLAIAALAWGLQVLSRARVDIFPEFAPPQVSIQTEAPGFAPEQVERLVTRPIEDVILGVTGIAAVRSQSIQGLSVITAVLERGIDIHRARQSLAERLVEAAGRLPRGVRAPVLTPLTSSSSTVLVVGLTSRARSPLELRTFADWTLKPRLLATPGVAKVAVFGGQVAERQLLLDPERLARYGIGVAEVVAAAREATVVRGGGVLDTPNQRLVVQAEGAAASPEALARVVVRASGPSRLRLGDLARVADGPAVPFGEGAVNDEPGCVIVISAQLGANTRVVAAAVERTLAQLEPAVAREAMVLHPALFRPVDFIDLAIRNIASALLVGGGLVAVVLVLFLADWRAAAISLTAIPLSLLAAVTVLDALGQSLNTLTIGGLAIALGEVVDDAIIDVENIARRLRDARAAGGAVRIADVVLHASLEVRTSVVYATVVVACVFLPVISLSGVQGALFRPLAVSYILAILASLVVALTVTPALTLALLGRGDLRDGDTALLAWCKRAYVRGLDGLLGRPGAVLGGAGLLVLAAVAAVPGFALAFLPEFREGHYLIHMSAVPGTSLEETRRLGFRVTRALRAHPAVRSVAQRIGRAELSEDTWGTHYTEFEVDLRPEELDDPEAVEDALRTILAGFPGVNFALRGFLAERIEETLTGSSAPLVVRVVGDDLDSLDVAARRVAEAIAAQPGTRDVQYDPPPVTPHVGVRLDPAALERHGVRPDQALAALEAAARGVVVGQVLEPGRTLDVVVALDRSLRDRPEGLAAVPVAGVDGRLVRLGEVAGFSRTSGRSLIQHVGARRVATVTAGVEAADAERVAGALEARFRDPAALPRGVFAEVAGSGLAGREARRELLLESVLAAAAIVLLLAVAFGETTRLLLLLANLPLALVGGVLAVWLTGGGLSLGSLVGFVTLFGIATRNAVMLLSHYDHLVAVEGATWSADTARRGALERLGPILMTALVTAIALLPLALGSGDPGREIEGPMAIVILGGLLTSTVLSLVVLPVLAARYGRFDRAVAP